MKHGITSWINGFQCEKNKHGGWSACEEVWLGSKYEEMLNWKYFIALTSHFICS